MSIRSTLRGIKRNPLGFALSASAAAAAVFASAIGLLWMSYTMYAAGLAKSIISDASGQAPSIEKFYVNIFTGECVFENLKVMNPQDFDTRKYLRDNHSGIIQSDEMFAANKLRVKVSPLSVILGEPEVSEVEMSLTSVNAIRITPRMFNLPMFMRGISERVSTPQAGLKLFKISLNPAKDSQYSAIYLDFSSAKDVINIGQKESFSFERSNAKIKDILSDLQSEISKKTSMPFLSKAIGSYLD